LAKAFTILIADRNRHIRDLLRREMTGEGYRVRLAKSAGEVLKCIYDSEPVDLVILDWDMPDARDMALLDRIADRIPTLPVVVHAFAPVRSERGDNGFNTVFVEKAANSVDAIKRAVLDLVKGTDPVDTSAQKTPDAFGAES